MAPQGAPAHGAAVALWTVARPGYLVALLVAGWAANVSVLTRRKVDLGAALSLARSEQPAPADIFLLALAGALALAAVHLGAALAGPSPQGIGCVLLLYAVTAWVLLGRLPARLEARAPSARVPFARALGRCFWPEPGKEVPFAQVLVADCMTSLARALFDLALGSCAALGALGIGPGAAPVLGNLAGAQGTGQVVLLGDALEQCGQSPVPFLFWAAPFVIRVTQCWLSSRNAPDAVGRALHRLNLVKYLSALPIVCIALVRARVQDDNDDTEELEMFGALVTMVNAAFSLLWDLAMDWGLLSALGSGHFGLRPTLLLSESGCFYYSTVALDALARACWSLRWLPDVALLGGFWLGGLLQAVEVARRSLWSLLRVEWQCVRAGGAYAVPEKQTAKEAESPTPRPGWTMEEDEQEEEADPA